jgi:hypothetical protein
VTYQDWAVGVLGRGLPATLHDTKLHAWCPPESPWHQKFYDALNAVEQDYAASLVSDLAARNVPGHFAEFGVFQGAWINLLHEMTERIGFKRQIWGFDSFQGLSAPDPRFDSDFWREGMYSASLADVSERVRARERRRIELVEGFFSESLRGAKAQSLKQICYARIDCDLYEPAAQCLNYLANRLSDGAILVFDDWTHDTTVGEGRAFAEWIPTAPHLRFEVIFLGPWDHLYLRVHHR